MDTTRGWNLRTVFRAFERFTLCFEDAPPAAGAPPATALEGATPPSGAPTPPPAPATGQGGEPGAGGSNEPPMDDIETYRGSKEVNPDQLPLRDFDRRGKSKQEIDSLISVAGSRLFKTPEEVKADDEKAKAEVDKAKEKPAEGEKKEGNDTPDGKDVGKTGEKAAGDDAEITAFFEATGLSDKEFNLLSPKAQENLVNRFYANKDGGDAAKKIEERAAKAEQEIAELKNDPVVLARLEEKKSGRGYVARQLASLSENEAKPILDAIEDGDRAKASQLLNQAIHSRAQQAIKIERSVAEQKSERAQLKNEALGVLKKMGDLDERLKFSKDEEYTNGEVAKFLADHDYTYQQIIKLGSEKLYAVIATHKGWDQARIKKAVETEKKSLLEKLRKPDTARELDPHRRSSTPKQANAPARVDREGLVEQLAAGDPKQFNDLLRANDGNQEMLSWLRSIQGEAIRRSKERERTPT